MYFGTGSRLQNTVLPTQVMVAGSNIYVSDSVQILGMTLDSTLALNRHVNNILKTCN